MAHVHSFYEVGDVFSDFSADAISDPIDATLFRTCALEINVTSITGTSLTVELESAIEEKGGFRQQDITGTISTAGRHYLWINEFESAGTAGEAVCGWVRLRINFTSITVLSMTARALFK